MDIRTADCVKTIPNLGIGVGLRPPHYGAILNGNIPIDWFEIISENFMEQQGANFEFLERILDRCPVVLHGVSLCIGSSDPLDFSYLKQLKALARKTNTPWISDHLSWGKLEGAHFHDLLPLVLSKEVEDYVVERARIVQDFLELPFALENISSYMSYAKNEMTEWEFYANVVSRANIYMMLDVNNIYVSSVNNHFSPKDYINHLPLDRVIQIHLAGHTDHGDYLLDTHNNYVCDKVWELYGEVYSRIGGVSTLLEWDEHFLSFEATCQEALKAKHFQEVLCR